MHLTLDIADVQEESFCDQFHSAWKHERPNTSEVQCLLSQDGCLIVTNLVVVWVLQVQTSPINQSKIYS